VGLANIQSRLEGLYGSEQRLELRTHPQGGTIVRVVLPLRRTESASAPAAASTQ
jgi:sensor histidine kinase YesM